MKRRGRERNREQRQGTEKEKHSARQINRITKERKVNDGAIKRGGGARVREDL